MAGPLVGLCVIDLTTGMAGSMATGQLADYGATIIRVEPPGGDPSRNVEARAVYDRGKKSVVVDPNTGPGFNVLNRLLQQSDALVETWLPGEVPSGLGPEIMKSHPRLVYCSILGYPAGSSQEARPAFDSLVSARMGLMNEQLSESGGPSYLGIPIASIGAAMLTVIGVTAAILDRSITGRGQRVETSLSDGALAFMNMFWADMDKAPANPTPANPIRKGPRTYRLLSGTFQCGDAEFLGIHTGAQGAHARLMKVLGLDDQVPPAPGEREKLTPLTLAEAEIVEAEVPKRFLSEPRTHWLSALTEADVPAIPVLRPVEVLVEPQTLHNGVVVDVEDPHLGALRQVGLTARFAGSPGEIRSAAPRPGEHTQVVLEGLGFSSDEIDYLRNSGIVE